MNRHKRIKGSSGSRSFVPLALLWLDFSFCEICGFVNKAGFVFAIGTGEG